MGKILEKEFRNELYKNLCEAGYSKGEATSIVSVKYSSALKEDLIGKLNQFIKNVDEDNYDFTINGEEINNSLSELGKLKEFFAKKESREKSEKSS